MSRFRLDESSKNLNGVLIDIDQDVFNPDVKLIAIGQNKTHLKCVEYSIMVKNIFR